VDSSVDLLRWQFGAVHRLLASSSPAARYAEAVVIEDITISSLVSNRKPLALSTWRGRTGLSRLPPLGQCHPEPAWSDSVAINPTELRTYAQAVHAATDAYLSRFTPTRHRLTLCVLTALLLNTIRRSFGSGGSAPRGQSLLRQQVGCALLPAPSPWVRAEPPS
jgi:hypothetical protein